MPSEKKRSPNYEEECTNLWALILHLTIVNQTTADYFIGYQEEEGISEANKFHNGCV